MEESQESKKNATSKSVAQGAMEPLSPAAFSSQYVEQLLSELEEAKRKSKASEALLKDIEEVALTGIYEVDIATMAFRFSDGLYRLFGEEPQSFVPSLAFIDARSHSDDIPAVKQILEQAIVDKQPYYYTRRIYTKQGELRILEAHGKVMCDSAGNAITLMGLVQDITKRNKAEQDLREQAHFTRSITDTMPDVVTVVEHPSRKLLYANRDPMVMMGLDAGEIISITHEERKNFLHPDDLPKLMAFYNRYESLPDGEINLVEYRIRNKKGDWVWLAVRGKVLQRDKQGKVSQSLNIGQDITARKKAELEVLRLKDEAAQKATDRYLTLFNSIDEGFYLAEVLFDANNHPVDVFYQEENPAAVRIIGTSVKGKKLTELSPHYERYWYEIFGKVAITGKSERLERYADLPKKWFNFYVTKLGNEHSRQVAIVFHDSTEHKLTEEKQQFLLQLSDALRPLSDAVEIQARATQVAMHYFKADRCYYCEIEGDTAIIRHDAFRQNLPSVVGSYALSKMPIFNAVVERGHTFVVQDANTTRLMDENLRQLCIQMKILSYIDVPVLKNAKPTGVFCLTQCTPRDWTDIEVNLAEEIAERIWAAVERAKAEEALRISEEHFRMLITATSDTVYKMSADWKQLYNLKEKNLFSTMEVSNGTWLRQYIPQEDQPIIQAAIDEAIEKKQIFQLEHRISQPDGSLIWVYSRAIPVLNAAGEIIEWFGAASNITIRKEAEQRLKEFTVLLEKQVAEQTYALKESRDLLQSVFDTSLIAMAVLEAVRNEYGVIQDFRICMVNKELERGAGRTDLAGKLYAVEYPGIKAAGLFDLMCKVVETGKPASMEYYYPYEGIHKWYSSMFVKMDDGLVATNLDITERKQAEEEILKQYHLLKQSEEVARMGSWEYNVATGSFTWSEGMYRLFGLPQQTQVRPEIYLQYAIEADKAIAKKIVDCFHNYQDLEETLRIEVNQQLVTLKIKAMYHKQGKPAKLLGVDVDTSELKYLEEENLSIRLRQQQQLMIAILEAQEEERRRISESLHNGVGQILYAIKLNIDRIDLDLLPGKRVQVAEAVETVEDLLTKAISETRRVSHELVPVLLKEFGLETAITEFCKHYSGSELHIQCRVKGFTKRMEPHLEVAFYRISQELINNIVKHSCATKALLLLRKTQKEIVLEAKDNGKGFESPYTASTGFGLRTIQDRVKLLNGTIDVTTHSGKGVHIVIHVPVF